MIPQYFGVIGNRDYIKIKGVKRPFWEFLDRQPAGWLTSIVYHRKDIPLDRPLIFDCGAWSYKDKDEPDYTPKQALDEYAVAPDGAMVIAPDHMLIPGVDCAKRRKINLRNAKEFIDICPARLVPMATVHGETVDERVAVAESLVRMGYARLALGGMAAQAARKSLMMDVAERVRGAVPVWLHVLGLSSPTYARAWRDIGIQSFDGSSHFKQAFTGGAFYAHDGNGGLTKFQAARPGNADDGGIVAPRCDCLACSTLRIEGVDTRSFGSNEHNMGRAAHNLNMLMQAQEVASLLHVVLVACCGQKLTHPAPAKDLYQSDLFRKSRQWAEQNGDRWLILSAKYGVVHPDQVIEPYDEMLSDKSAADRRKWSEKVAGQLKCYATDSLTVLAGKNYCGWCSAFAVERPMEGLGIGQQLAWLLANSSVKKSNQGTIPWGQDGGPS